MNNRIGGEVVEVPRWAEFRELFSKPSRLALDLLRMRHRGRYGVIGIARFENRTLDSSHLGEETAVVYGPSCTVTDLRQSQLGETPSTFKYPTHYWRYAGEAV